MNLATLTYWTYQQILDIGVSYDSCWVEVNLATLTYWAYQQILDIGAS